ncbi:Fur family transcriptional regulator [Synoicihabitans lomoniglobus]|uniref:Transcriptional repressor n=1 Tax=Synoicihabitans lomoniglobus TaxID=2909285 RepID=A0AAF0CP64_9BACT|nr:transcriptional repressor [Opitutaceae bacterium LMO-M01]WED65510.1 transcriptional repressor [Opitutaceae bacterium LMO-M01]
MSVPATQPVESFTAAANQHWHQRGSRRTQVRDVICKVVAERPALFTAEQLHPLARAVDRGISLASIYRTLSDLCAFGLLHESRGAHDERCYAVVSPELVGKVASAATLVCRDCGELHPLDNSCLVMREGFAAKQAGFNPRKLDLRIEADCESFRATGHCDRANRDSTQP